MGGTFDPIHIGHLILGEAAYEQFGLDEVWFLPAGNPPHKRNRAGQAKDAQRVEMVRRAIASNPHFVLCTKEMEDEGYTYSYRTLEAMRKEHPGTEFYFIIGADSLFYFDEWKNPERICAAAKILVATRDRAKEKELLACMERNAKKLHGTFLKLDTPNLDVSSHELPASPSVPLYSGQNLLFLFFLLFPFVPPFLPYIFFCFLHRLSSPAVSLSRPILQFATI